MLLLTSLALSGNIASNLLGEARAVSGFNSTQAQICLLLAGLQDKAGPTVLTPAEISRALCSPGAKVHNQLTILVRSKLLQRSTDVASADERLRHYALTREGIARTRIYWEHARRADAVFGQLLTRKDIDALERLAMRLRAPIASDALGSNKKLLEALATGGLAPPRRQRS